MSYETIFETWTNTRTFGDHTVVFKSRQILDEYGYESLDHLGEFVARMDEYTIDRARDRSGAMLFHLWAKAEPEQPGIEEPDADDYTDYREYEAAYDAYQAAWDAYDEAMDEWDENPYETMEIYGRTSYVRNSYRYFKPMQGSEIERYRREGNDEAAEECIKYAIEDWQRAEAFNLDDWCMTAVITEMHIGDELVDEESLWGIESDSEDEYLEQVVEDQIQELLYKFKTDGREHIETIRATAFALENVFAALEEAA